MEKGALRQKQIQCWNYFHIDLKCAFRHVLHVCAISGITRPPQLQSQLGHLKTSDGSPSLPVSAADKRLQENKIHLDDNKDIRSLIHQLAWDCAFAGFERASQVVHLAVKP